MTEIILPVAGESEFLWPAKLNTAIVAIRDAADSYKDAAGNLVVPSDKGLFFASPTTGTWLLKVNGAGDVVTANQAAPPPIDPTAQSNILAGKLFTSDVSSSTTEAGNPPSYMTDTLTTTRTITQPVSPANFTCDMGGVYTLDKVEIIWAGDTVKNYALKVSLNNVTWTTVYTGITNNTPVQAVTYTTFAVSPRGRYFQITCTDRWNAAYGNSIWDVKAFGVLDLTQPIGSIANFTGTVVSNTAVNLAWEYAGSALTNFTLQRNGVTIASPAAGAVSYSDTGLTAGTQYTYTLVGNFTAGGSSNTATVIKTTTGGTVGAWLSGASCVGAANISTDATKSFGAWRGTPVEVAVTWPNSNTLQVSLPTLQAGAEYGSWDRPLHINIGAIDTRLGETWGAAAAGSYEARWTQSWTNLRAAWARIPRDQWYIGFAHELNGNWFPWSVSQANVSNFKLASARWRKIGLAIFPEAKTVLCPNGNTSNQTYDSRTLWAPDEAGFLGRHVFDVYGTDWYSNQYAAANGAAAGGTTAANNDGFGGPQGLESHRLFALSKGVPFCVPEWAATNNNGGTGDDVNYIQAMKDFFALNAGTGAGQVLYEVYFNIDQDYPNSLFQLFYPAGTGTTTKPLAAARYVSIF